MSWDQQSATPALCKKWEAIDKSLQLEDPNIKVLNEATNIAIALELSEDIKPLASDIKKLFVDMIRQTSSKKTAKEAVEVIMDLLDIFPAMNVHGDNGSITKERTLKDKKDFYFEKFVVKFFPSLKGKSKDFEDLNKIVMTVRNDFIPNLNNPLKKREVIAHLETDLKSLDICHAPLSDLFSLLEGDLSQLSCIFTLSSNTSPQKISPDHFRNDIEYLKSAYNTLNHEIWRRLDSEENYLKNNIANNVDQDKVNEIEKKIKEGTATNKDLFYFADHTGNSDGSISQSEFSALAKRMNIHLTRHRIQEIFSEIKSLNIKGSSTFTLNEREFEKAMEYLQEKNVDQGLKLLGITSERLYTLLLALMILLLLIFLFIFLGIQALTLGGTFGSIINSTFPAFGGIGLGKQSPKPHEKLEEEHIENIGEKSQEITGSQEL